MDESQTSSQHHLRGPHPWPFGRGEIMAGLRRLSDDPTLTITDIQGYEIPNQRPSIGQVRGLRVDCLVAAGEQVFHLVLKEPLGATRVGTAGVGLREVSVYRNLTDQLPLLLPRLVASHPAGEWLVIELTPSANASQDWTANNYRDAIRALVSLHDRFWGLGRDLTIFNWLSRPLDSDFAIYIQAAASGAKRLTENTPPALLAWDPTFPDLIDQLVQQAGEIANTLKKSPSTFLHGDYWPGNLQFNDAEELVVFDWQQAGIGPGVLDLVHFTQSSRWWFAPIPLNVDEIVEEYREALSAAHGHTWNNTEWQALWDYGLLWIFITNWIDLLAATPHSLIETRLNQLEEIWLDPLREAAGRRKLPEIR